MGPISVADYMTLALGHPRYGYYMARDPLGAAGDFITAPEISQMFGELIGLWCAVVWQQMGRPAPVLLVELGPGRGTLLADALRAARTRPDFAAALRVHLVETSPFLRKQQEMTLAKRHPGLKVEWHERLEDAPAVAPILVVANEFFDALPIRQYVRTGEGWWERRIGLGANAEGFAFALEKVDEPDLPQAWAVAERGVIVETGAQGAALARTIGARTAQTGGAALVIDYGYTHPAPGETLQAVRHHVFQDILDRPGETDLTAHVNFAALAAAAEDGGARAYGPIAQGLFLSRLGIAARAQALMAGARRDQAASIASGLRRLVHPAEMGAMFKALALAHPHLPPPPGFIA